MTGNHNDPTLYPHSTDFTGRPPPPEGGYSWDQIKEALNTNTLHTLRRTDKGQHEYEVWQAGIDLTKYSSIGEYIAFTILGWTDLKDPADATIQSNWTQEELEEHYRKIEPRLNIRVNHYPVPVQESIQYFVVWSTRDMSTLQERARLDAYLNEKFESQVPDQLALDLLPPAPGKKKDWMWFVNPPQLRSVATVHHIHVFVRDVDL